MVRKHKALLVVLLYALLQLANFLYYTQGAL
jgi:hypothetical protein